MKRYDPTEAVPMAFHKFNHWVRIPFSIAGTLYLLYQLYQQKDTVSDKGFAMFTAYLVYSGVLLLLLLVAFVGFFGRRANAYKANMVTLILMSASMIAQCIVRVNIPYGMELYYWIVSILMVVLNALIAIYYHKRRLLFSAGGVEPSATEEEPNGQDGEPQA